ncbi:hypothetical protein CDAR_408071 [Caerostris darwini]|uniref:Uncharacterized protein n=1 Tax=Caerostris darwini TaxID=1538125 RepID=A0AAV4TNQ0_9ARAC|nr:hypothetical protein CDAR_408071 [Caerostris darwini]
MQFKTFNWRNYLTKFVKSVFSNSTTNIRFKNEKATATYQVFPCTSNSAFNFKGSSLPKLTFIKTNKVLEQQRLLVEGVTIVPEYDCFPNTKHIVPEASKMNLFSLRNPITSGDMCLQLRNGMSPILLKWPAVGRFL